MLKTSNVTALTIDFPPGTATFEPKVGGVTILLDQTRIDGPRVTSDRSWRTHWIKEGDAWKIDVMALLPYAEVLMRVDRAIKGETLTRQIDQLVGKLPSL